ncbi:MAG: hypothetical protein QME21_04135 [Anaerolineales bacterium]|nr:hypothetical protein [Anaerolineales bacterium]
MKRQMFSLTIALLVALFSTGAGPVSEFQEPAQEFLIARVPFQLQYCFYSFTDQLQFDLGIYSTPLNIVEPQLYFSESDAGATLWYPPPPESNIDEVISLLTNGEPNLMYVSISNRLTGQGSGTGNMYEQKFFGSQVGPNGVDLGGFDIHRVGVTFKKVDLYDIPSGTCYNMRFAVLFTQVATREACRYGGWRYLKRMDGSSFADQKACVLYVYTGR